MISAPLSAPQGVGACKVPSHFITPSTAAPELFCIKKKPLLWKTLHNYTPQTALNRSQIQQTSGFTSIFIY